MIPVYRFRDGFSTLRNNARTIDRCVGILNQGESVLIFAEGNHGDRFQLRTLQRGVVKIAELAGRNQNIAVVPVGINYELNRGFRSRVLITFCQPLFTNELITGSEIPFADRLLDEIETRLQNSILHIPEDNYEERYQHLIKNRLYNADPEKQLELDKKVVDTFPSVPEIKNDNVPASAPVINAFANLNLFIPRLITRKWILPHFEDPQFLGPVTWAAGMVVVPLWLACSGILISVFTGRWWTGVIYVSVAVLSIWLLKKNPVPET